MARVSKFYVYEMERISKDNTVIFERNSILKRPIEMPGTVILVAL